MIPDTNALQAELRSGRVDIAPLPTSLSPDAIKLLGQDPNLQVLQFSGSNLNLLTFNCSQPPLNDVRVRQAIAYAVDREGLIRDLLLGQGKIAHSILPEESWAYTPGQIYSFDPAKAKKLLDEAGFRDPDGDGPQMRFAKPVVFKVSGSSASAKNYAGVIQNYLKNVGIPVSIETSELNTLLDELRQGKLPDRLWAVGGRQSGSHLLQRPLCHRGDTERNAGGAKPQPLLSNKELDALLDEAVNTFDREKAKTLYARIQEIVSREVPVLPLWYQANMVIARKTVGNIKVDASGDWGFVRNLTVGQ